MKDEYLRGELAPSVTEEERVCLVQLMEEAAELIAICSKTLRWGFDSRHPFAPEEGTNGDRIEAELQDVREAYARLNAVYSATPDEKRSGRQPRRPVSALAMRDAPTGGEK